MEKQIQVKLYSRPVCPLCEEAKAMLLRLKDEYPIAIHEIDIYQDDELLEKYQLMIPVVEIAGVEVDYGNIFEGIIRDFLQNLHNNVES